MCLHAANAPAMVRTIDVVGRLRDAGLAPVLRRVTDYAVSDHDKPSPGEAFVNLDPGPLDRRFVAATIPDQVAFLVSEAMTLSACSQPGRTLEARDIAASLQGRILNLAGFGQLADSVAPAQPPPAAQRLTTMNAEQLIEFVQANQQLIRSCGLSPASLT